MIKQENPNFVASKHAPNPNQVSYWIDLSSDNNGNVIKSYNPDLKKWIQINQLPIIDLDTVTAYGQGLADAYNIKQYID